MKHERIVVSRYGGAAELQLVEEQVPEPRTGEVRVKVHAAGVAMPDVMAREGIHPETPRVPYIVRFKSRPSCSRAVPTPPDAPWTRMR